MPILSRRLFLSTASAVIAVGLLPRFAFAAPVRLPLKAKVRPVVDRYFGEAVVDPYRWMESAADPDWLPFLRGQNLYARDVLDSISGRIKLERRIFELSSATSSAFRVKRSGSNLFYLKRLAGASKLRLWARELNGGEERLLVNPDSFPGDANTIATEFSVSPNGRLLLFGIDQGGREMPVYQLLDIATGKLLGDRIERAFTGDIASIHWRPDSAGFFYSQFADGRQPGAADMLENAPLRYHRVGDAQSADAYIIRRDGSAPISLRPTEWLMVTTSPDSPTAILSVGDGVGRWFRIYSAPLAAVAAGVAKWKPVCAYEDQVVDFSLKGNRLYLVSTKEESRGTLRRTSAEKPNLASAAHIPVGDVIVEKISAAREGLYVQTMDGGYNSLKIVEGQGPAAVRNVPLPYEGAIYELDASQAEDGVFLLMSGWTQPSRAWRFDHVRGKTIDLGLTPPSPYDLSGYEVVRLSATARDGTKVPLSLVMKKGLERDGSNPCLIEAYGAYRTTLGPAFSPRWLAFLEQGGIMGTAHVRGGGEFGHSWHMGGFKASKPNSWRDLIACAEEAVRQGFTSPRCLAIEGASAGGITVGRAMTERPDLFAAVLSGVGINNPLRFETGQNGSTNTQEFGSVATPEGFAGLRAMDSYHSVSDRQTYPAVLLTTGINDPRVPTWQVGKLAARLQASRSSNPVLLRVQEAAGHGGGSTLAEQAAELADQYAFVLWRTGHAAFQPRR